MIPRESSTFVFGQKWHLEKNFFLFSIKIHGNNSQIRTSHRKTKEYQQKKSNQKKPDEKNKFYNFQNFEHFSQFGPNQQKYIKQKQNNNKKFPNLIRRVDQPN